jgi:hypothetical protein
MSYQHRSALIDYINKIWKNNEVPEILKTIKIIPIQKPNKPVSIDSLRPISLLPVILKLCNAAIKNRVIYKLESNNKLPDLTFGFRRESSTVDCINILVNEARNARRKGLFCLSVFIDIKSAFDDVNLDILYTTLQKFDVPQRECNWIYNFLINRNTELYFHRNKMKFNVCKGLPQGDVLSPELFNKYTARYIKM